MGTKVQGKSYLLGYHSMRDLNKDSNWPLYCGDKTLSNGQYCNGFLPRATVDAYPEYVKRTMLEHEAIFKNQVYELHRLYRRQRNLMDETKRKELDKNRIPFETSLSSSPLASQNTSEDGQKSSIRGFPLSSSVSARPSISKSNGTSSKSKDIEVLESRPTKVQRKMFDLELPASEYIDTEEGEQFRNDKSSSYGCEGGGLSLRSSNGLADLNEPIQPEDILGVPKEISMSAHHGSHNGAVKIFLTENNENGRMQFPRVYEAGQSRSYINSTCQGFFPEKFTVSSQPIQARINEMPTFHNEQSKTDLWRERTACGLDNSERSRSHPDSGMSSHMLGHYPVAPNWSQSVLSRDKPSSVSQMPIPFQLSKSSQSFDCSHGVFGNAWDQPSVSKANPGLGREQGFYHGSPSGSKDVQAHLSSISHDCENCNNGYNAVSEPFSTQGSSKHYNGLNCTEMRPARDVNLNVALSTSSSHEAVDGEREQEGHCVGLPWLRSKLVKKSAATDSRDSRKDELSFLQSSYQLSGKSEIRNCPDQPFSDDVEIVDGPKHKRIFGVSIVEKPCMFENECPGTARLSETNSKCTLIDINLPCDAASPENRTNVEVSVWRHLIDLNSCVSEAEASLVPSSKAKAAIEIELEVAADEGAKMAAEAIVGISSFVGPSMADPLNWFAEIACSFENEEVDYFESMTLKLRETKADESLVPDNLQVEETGGPWRARRGRQRRDFQRDILPGLTTLSRHHVREDLQTLMRATGQSRRRNGCGRGNPPQIVAAIPALTRQVVTGWGKTTRRPRRPRDNPESLPFT